MNRYYGFDKLGMHFMVLSIVLAIVALALWGLPACMVLMFLSTLFLIIAFYRMTSTNKLRRERELAGYQRMLTGIAGIFKRGPKVKKPKEPKVKKEKKKRKSKKAAKAAGGTDYDPNYAYFTCPNCHKNLRVPKGLGSIKITCSSCGHQFIEKT